MVPLLRAAAASAVLLASTALCQDVSFAAKVDKIVARHLERPNGVGLSVGVLWKGELLARGYGIAEAEFEVPANAETMFRIGSITKQFTSAMVLRLVEQGKVSLDDASTKHVPEFATGERTVTVRQLLNHTSGIPSYTDQGAAWREVWPLELSHEQLLDLVRELPFDFEPGQSWHYNNTGYYLLGMLLENVEGKPYAALVKDLAAELSLQRTRYDSNRRLIKNRAQGYNLSDGELTNDLLLGMQQPGGAGGMLSTGKDLVLWARALHTGKVVSKPSYQAMITSEELPNGRDPGYGFGLMPGQFDGQRSIGHGGGIHGFNSQLHWLPEHDFYVAVISNCGLSAQGVAEDLTYELLDLKRPEERQKPVSKKLRDALVGTYACPKAGMDLHITAEGDKLFAQGSRKGQGKFGLLHQGDGAFCASFDEGVRVVFAVDGSSLVLHQAGMEFPATRKQ